MEIDNTTQTQQVVQVINDFCLQSPDPIILGSQIGANIKSKLPDLNFKEKYFGLGDFIQNYCSTTIFLHGKRGPDNLYIHKDRVGENEGLVRQRFDTWSAFCNPKLDIRLYVHPEHGEFKCLDSQAAPPNEGFVEINRMSAADYRAFAESVIQHIEREDLQASLTSIIARPDFWFEFAGTMKSNLDPLAWSRFLQSRILFIRNKLAERLVSAGMSEELAEKIVSELPQKIVKATASAPAPKVANGNQITISIHAILHEAIDLMRPDELREFKLPLGIIMDVLKKLP